MAVNVFEKFVLDESERELLSESHLDNVFANKLDDINHNEGGSFDWLLNGFSEKTWRLKPHIESEEPSKYTIQWFYDDLENMSGWGYWVDVCKDVCVAKMNREDRCKLKTGSLAGYARHLRSLARFLYIKRNCSLVEDISLDDINAYKQALIERELSSSTLESAVIPLHDLYLLRGVIKQPLKFDPFSSTNKTQWAKTNGKADGHTKTLVPRETFYLLNEAIKRVSTSKKDLYLLDIYMEIRGSGEELDRGVAAKFKRRTGESSGVLIKRIRELYGAALVVCFLLTAERKHEAALRNESDVVDLLESELDILVGVEKKTSGSISGKKTEVAVIQEVKDAFGVIMEITKYTRSVAGTSKVLLKLPMAHCVSGYNLKHYYLSSGPMYSLLMYFGKSCGFDIALRPHMFRRAYAMIWSWRYEVGDLHELSKMLKHNNEIFTKRYTDDEDIWEFMPDAHQKIAFDILNRAFSQKIKVSGGASKTLERYSRIIQVKSKILNPTEIAHFIDDLINSGEITIVVHADGYCVFTKETKCHSKCLNSNGEIDEARREESRCAGCPNLGIDDRREAYWQRRIELHQQVIENSTKPVLVEKSKRFIADIKNSLAIQLNC
ncbi:site-specific integrase [Vibrio cholerae]|uniref:hypothetical protein n=1 Tax=Vibrio cholerae TaxID=666 RepID=UPI00226E3B73|nr:hypothetical protein [Vibrio cholerae]MCX9537681.1 site-specific integrase [Vibrio cholerae]